MPPPTMPFPVKAEPVRIPDVSAVLSAVGIAAHLLCQCTAFSNSLDTGKSKVAKAFSPSTDMIALMEGEDDEEGRRCRPLCEPPDP